RLGERGRERKRERERERGRERGIKERKDIVRRESRQADSELKTFLTVFVWAEQSHAALCHLHPHTHHTHTPTHAHTHTELAHTRTQTPRSFIAARTGAHSHTPIHPEPRCSSGSAA